MVHDENGDDYSMRWFPAIHHDLGFVLVDHGSNFLPQGLVQWESYTLGCQVRLILDLCPCLFIDAFAAGIIVIKAGDL